jgi:AbrB family looped-hinge helix DNA binding protein
MCRIRIRLCRIRIHFSREPPSLAYVVPQLPESGLPDSINPTIMHNIMEVLRLGKKGQVSLPKAMLKRLGLAGESLLLVDVTPEGAILLKPAGVYPIETYSEKRINEFLTEDHQTPEEQRRIKRRIRSAR